MILYRKLISKSNYLCIAPISSHIKITKLSYKNNFFVFLCFHFNNTNITLFIYVALLHFSKIPKIFSVTISNLLVVVSKSVTSMR